MTLDAVLARIDDDLPRALDRLLDLLRIPSISTDPAYKGDCDRAADWLVEDLARHRLHRREAHDARVIRWWWPMRPAPAPHLLFYGHYDVQPVDPLALWHRAAIRSRDRGNAERAGHPRAWRRPMTRASS